MTHDRIASDLLTPLWQGIPVDYKAKYARNIWQQFENQIKSAAYTSSLSLFLSRIMGRMGIAISDAHAAKVAAIIQGGDDREILKMLRDDTALLVLLVRVANEERREKTAKGKFLREQTAQAEEGLFK